MQMSLWQLVFLIKVKYLIGILCCIVMVVLLSEKRHFHLIPQWHIVKQGQHPPNSWHFSIVNASSVAVGTSGGNLLLYEVPMSPDTPTERKVLPELDIKRIGLLNYTYDLIKMASINKKMITIVVSETSDVILLDEQYKTQWKTTLFPDGKPNGPLKAGKIQLEERLCITGPPCGVVFIGLAYANIHEHSSSHVENQEGGDHFSTFALHLYSGSIIWHHMPGDFLVKDTNQSDPVRLDGVHNHWKLNLLRQHKAGLHVGEIPWTACQRDVFLALPHSWSRVDDTQLYLSNFAKDRLASAARGRSYGGGHNSLVAKYHTGLDILDLFTGRPLTRLQFGSETRGRTVTPLSRHHSPHLMLVQPFSQLSASTAGFGGSAVHCGASITRFLPTSSDHLFPDSIPEWRQVDGLCYPVSYFDYARFAEEAWTEDASKMVPPIVTQKSIGKAGGVWGLVHHFMGGNLHTSDARDLVFLTSEGALTSYSSAGHVNWRTNSQVSWLHLSNFVKAGHRLDDIIHDVYVNQFEPTTTLFDIDVGNKMPLSAVLVVGWDSLSLVDLTDGHLLATHSLPCHPTHRPTIEGRHFYIHCDTLVIKFSLIDTDQWMSLLAVSIAFILSFLLVSWCCDPNNSLFTEINI